MASLLVASVAGFAGQPARAASSRPAAKAAVAVPDAPFVTSVTSQGLGVLVSWAPDPAVEAVSGYAISVVTAAGAPTPAQGCGGPFTSSTNASQSAVLVGGLCAGVAYQATVAASNAGGSSVPSSPYGPVAALAAQAPGLPLVTGVYARASSLLVSWAAPAISGGSPVTGYSVTATPASGTSHSITATATATSATVTGLTNGTVYTVSLVATNAVGSSAAASGTGTPAAVHHPTAPVGVSAAPNGSGSVVVSWTAPVDNGGSAVTGYVVAWQQVSQATAGGAYTPTKGSKKLSVSLGPTVTTYTVVASKLTPAAALYAFTVTAKNTTGASAAGAPTSPVSPVTTTTSQTTVLTASTMADLTSDTPTATGSTLTWAAPVPTQISALKTGAVLVASPGGAASQGLLDTVATSTTDSTGAVTLTTTQASLPDVFSTLALSSSADPAATTAQTGRTGARALFHPTAAGIRTLAPALAAGQASPANPQATISYSPDVRLGVDYNPSDSQGAFVSGEVDVNPQLSLTVNLDHGFAGIPNGVNLSATGLVKSTVDVKVGFQTPDDWKKVLGEIDGTPIDFQVGLVPIVVVPKVVVQISLSGQIANVVSESMTVGGSLSWDSKNAGVLTTKNLSSLHAAGGWLPQFAVNGTATAELTFQPQLDFYDVAGPNFQVDAGVEVDATLNPSAGQPYLSISPYVEVDAGLDVDVLEAHASLEVPLAKVTFATFTLIHGPGGQLTISPAQTSVAPGASTTLAAAGGSGALTWGLTDGAGDTISSSGVFTAANPPGRSVTVTVTDAAGDIGQAIVNVGSPFDPVQNLTATLSGDKTAATVSWQPPANTGGSAIAHFVLTGTGGIATQTLSGTITTISGMNPSDIYTVTVQAVNAAGQTGPAATSTVPGGGANGLDATSLVSDGFGSCALLSGGTADCWGYNSFGELGNGTTTTYSDVPVRVTGLTGATALTNDGGDYGDGDGYCALLSGGTADCWGNNGDGELGNGTTTNSDVPVRVTGLTGATALTSNGDGGGYCALLSGGTADCWGYNGDGELGNGTTTNSDVPARVTGLTGATALTNNGDGDGYCALLSGGTADCWGNNYYGELGNGTTTDSDVPVRVTGLTGATALTSNGDGGGYCALLSGGTADCWGYNGDGELGNGTTTDSDVPVRVTGLTGATALTSSGDYGGDYGGGYCALLSGGTADCWGYNGDGELGNGTTTDSDVPVRVTGLTGATALTNNGAGYGYCALLSGGTADCWGNNYYGELGNGTTTDSDVPVRVTGLTGATALTSSNDGSGYCALLSGGTADCWGYNYDGALGNGTTTDSDVPVPVAPFS